MKLPQTRAKILFTHTDTLKGKQEIFSFLLKTISKIQYEYEIPNKRTEIIFEDGHSNNSIIMEFFREYKIRYKMFPHEWRDFILRYLKEDDLYFIIKMKEETL